MSAADKPAQGKGEDRSERRAALLAALAKLPRRRDFTSAEAASVAECKAFVAAGGQCLTTDEVMEAARARFKS